jgi:hypothetical protein
MGRFLLNQNGRGTYQALVVDDYYDCNYNEKINHQKEKMDAQRKSMEFLTNFSRKKKYVNDVKYKIYRISWYTV